MIHGNATLTEDEVRAIRRIWENGCSACGTRPTMEKLGAQFGISGAMVHKIVHRDAWKHVK